MIRKQKLLKELDGLLHLEKSLVPLLNKHVSSSISFSAIKKADFDVVMEGFQNIVIAKTKHIEMLEKIKREIERGDADVF